MRLIKSTLLLALVLIHGHVFANIESFFQHVKSDPNALYAFFKAMPKGGELHYHLAGGAYPETMLRLAEGKNYCLDTSNFIMSKFSETCSGVRAEQLLQKPELYDATIRSWSMKQFKPGYESRSAHFFATFFKFMSLVTDFRPQLLAEIMERAADQNENYLEIILLPDNARSAAFGELATKHTTLANKKKALLADLDFQQNIHYTVTESKRILEQARKELRCDIEPDKPVCNLTVRFQYYILREQALDNLFAQAVNAFESASLSPEIVAINLVQAEDGIISLRDYKKQMELIGFLHRAYPNVHITLHAGELSPTAVTPENLRFHIQEAIFTGQAERIGHGVTIAYENDADKLVQYMASKPIPVEINLTSNKEILDIEGKQHPLNYYLNHQVPVVLSTDDEGILRTDLSREYVAAVIHHGLDYPTIKTINRNALTYSFLSGQSIWSDPHNAVLVTECKELHSNACKQFIKNNEKARIQWRLENQLDNFEKRFR